MVDHFSFACNKSLLETEHRSFFIETNTFSNITRAVKDIDIATQAKEKTLRTQRFLIQVKLLMSESEKLTNTEFKKFNGDKLCYEAWSDRLKSRLIKEDVWSCTFKDEPEPTPPAPLILGSSNFVSSTHAQLIRDYKKELKEFNCQRNKAFGMIRESCDTNLTTFVDQSNYNPYLAWKSLKADYGVLISITADIWAVTDKMKLFKMKESENFSTWLLEFDRLRLSIAMEPKEAVIILHSFELLPPRMKIHLHKCRYDGEEPMEYLPTCVYLKRLDEAYHSENARTSSTSSAPKRINAVALTKRSNERGVPNSRKTIRNPVGEGGDCYCVNCCNPGHVVEACKSWYCRFCGIFKPEHGLAHLCPKFKNKNKHSSPGVTNSTSTPEDESSAVTDYHGGDYRREKRNVVNDIEHRGPPRKVRALQNYTLSDIDDEETDSSSTALSKEEMNIIKEMRRDRGTLRRVNRSINASVEHKYFIMDSGADVTCVPNIAMLSTLFNSPFPMPFLKVADGTRIPVTAQGSILNISPVFVTPSITDALLSVKQLAMLGYWTITLPDHLQDEVSAYVCNSQGEVVFTANKHGLVDLHAIPPKMTLSLPAKQNVCSFSRRVSLRGANYVRNQKDLILYLHQALGHISLTAMCHIADHDCMTNFPITSTAIRAGWSTCIACLKGKIVRRSLPRFKSTSEAVPPPISEEEHIAPPSRPHVVGEKVCSDIYPMPIGFGGKKYLITFTDATSGFLVVGSTALKSFVVTATEHVIDLYASAGHHKSTFDSPIGIFQSDSESVYLGDDITNLLRINGIRPQMSAPYVHQQNGVAERMHQTLGNQLATIYAAAPWMPVHLWPFAISYTTYCLNLHPRQQHDRISTPYELFWNTKPDFNKVKLMAWGQPLEFLLSNKSWKGGARSATGAFLNCCPQYKNAIMVYCFETQKERRTYTWFEHGEVPADWVKRTEISSLFAENEPEDNEEINREAYFEDMSHTPLDSSPPISSTVTLSSLPLSISVNTEPIATTPTLAASPLRVSSRQKSILFPALTQHLQQTAPTSPQIPVSNILPVISSDTLVGELESRSPPPTVTVEESLQLAAVSTGMPVFIPWTLKVDVVPAWKNYLSNSILDGWLRKIQKARGPLNPTMSQAQRSINKPEWDKAIQSEYAQLDIRNVYDVVKTVPRGTIPVRTHFVLKAVVDADGTILKYKARLVADGSQQHPSTFDAVRSPTSRHSTVKLVLNLSCYLRRRCVAYDVPGAYLHASTAEATSTDGDPNIFIQLPDKRVARLRKFLYGLKQSGLEWFEAHKGWILSLGFVQSPTEPCLYLWRENKGAAPNSSLGKQERYIILLVYVDDDLAVASDDSLEEWFHSAMKAEYGNDVKRKSDSYTFLGMKVHYDGYNCLLSMPAYCLKAVAESNLVNERIATTPESTTTPAFIDTSPADKVEFQRILGVVNYLALMCRHDLLGPISRLASCVSSPTSYDMTRLHRVLRYIKGTPNLGLVFRPSQSPNLECFVDASFDCHPDSKSHTGYCFFIGDRSGAFFARSAKQHYLLQNPNTMLCVRLD